MTVKLPKRNLLGEQTSPYLLQHKDNPVHWRPWSAEALEEAKRLNRPILLSIGYAACHWCHVMAHESFEDAEVADVMNRLFVNIKVDREERPDIDQIYMTALSATGEQGGWPLTMFLTPDAQPFWGGTYFPKQPRFGRPGFIQVLNAVHTAWREKQPELLRSAEKLTAHVHSQLDSAATAAGDGPSPLAELAGRIGGMVDPLNGGIRGAPKFPNAPFMDVLWLNWLERRTAQHRDAVLSTLRHMLTGGIFDHVGGGLARYSTDAMWLVPHFEKMLYDNAQLVRLCCFAYAETGYDLFHRRVKDTVSWLLREMQLGHGGFASSIDADSEGEEGKFYLWTRAEIEDVLGSKADVFLRVYDLASPAEWDGDPILNRLNNPHLLDPVDEDRLQTLLEKLRLQRERRQRPARDDKVLVDWNGITISSLVLAGRQFQKQEWIDAAYRAFRFIRDSMEEGRLPHSIREGRKLYPAIASDYAAMISAAISLNAALQDNGLIDQAMKWAEMLDRWHADQEGSGYYLTASDSTDVPLRIRGDVDDAVPSATSQIIVALIQLSAASGDHAIYERAIHTAENALRRTKEQPYGQAGIIHAAAIAERPLRLLIYDPDEELVKVANRIADPRRVDIILGEEEQDAERQLGITIDRTASGAWLCIGQACLPPFRDAVTLEAALRSQWRD
ncbi:thioredoxin domain-containing protein [Chelativorans sp. Marseille-P2723]|uniref:thioredoxin domain-containing protein n=1 Tax=Chelativorans sp. Marseille-P2723 TaxID=2709133 RepID=UPI00156E84D9|nr:thioredoxin domain-containing protein [Chelativorans sp. Marseille-P2723]